MTGLARKSAYGLLSIEDLVDRRGDRVDQILTGSGLEGSVFIHGVFLLCQGCICRDRLGLG